MRLEIDQDNISVNSVTSTNSDTNETVVGGVTEETDENSSSQPDKLLQDVNNVESVTTNKDITTNKDVIVSEEAEIGGTTKLDKEPVIVHNNSDNINDELKADDEGVKQAVAKDHDSAVVQNNDVFHIDKNAEGTISVNVLKEHKKVVEDVLMQDAYDKSIEVKADLGNKTEKHEVSEEGSKSPKPFDVSKPTPDISVEEYTDSVQSSDNDVVSNLDREIARLNSYLSETSESSTKDYEISSSSGTQILSSSIHARKDVESILLKDVQRYEDLEDEITRNFGKDEKEYKETDLDKQLKQLDFEASNSDFGAAKSPMFSPETSPSIYTLYKTPSVSQNDFYSEYPQSPESVPSNSFIPPSDNKTGDNMTDSIHILDVPQNPSMGKSVNMWTEITAQGNMLSLCASYTHIWYTDKSSNTYYSPLAGPGLTWRKASGYASQISVSPFGNIVWRLYKGVAHAGTKITTKCPEGMKWVQAVKGDVAYISVDETCAW